MKQPKSCSLIHLSDRLWDLWCLCSIIGIWPRWIEPNLLAVTKLTLSLTHLPFDLKEFKILHFSDLHIGKRTSVYFLNKLQRKISAFQPDLIVFTGDFLCNAQFGNKEKLLSFLKNIQAPYGCYAVLGNHDYAQTVYINDQGDYDKNEKEGLSLIYKGLSRLFSTKKFNKKVTLSAQQIPLNRELLDFLKQTPFQLLHNQTVQIKVKDSFLNITGLGEYTLGRCLPEEAFKNYRPDFPGISLLHNPDGFFLLKSYPSDIVLCGHTHGGQIYLPWIWKKFTLLENRHLRHGLFYLHQKWLYVSRGVGSIMPFRWFSLPELVQIKLSSQ